MYRKRCTSDLELYFGLMNETLQNEFLLFLFQFTEP